MSNSIVVENLSKLYQIGELQYGTMFREAMVRWITPSFRKKSVETIWALKDVSLTVKDGEVLGIIGRNGAGKSTLLKVLSKITYPTSGKMRVSGRISSLLEVGTGFHEELTGRENIYLNGSILGMTRKGIRSKLDSIIDFSGVGKFIDTPIKRYSSGMRLRLGFAVAAHLDSEILLIDEVLAVGDAEFQKRCLQSMDDLSRHGRTVLFVSHNMAAVEHLCPRVIWVENGKVQQDDNGSEVIKNYLGFFAGTDQTCFDLKNIEGRSGNGDIRYTEIELLDSDGSTQTIVRSGDSLLVRLHYHAERRIKNPHFALELFTDFGAKVTSLNTWTSGFDIPILPPGDGYIDLAIDSLNIRADRYYVSLWLASHGGKWYDRLDNCVTLEVEASDFHRSGREMNTKHYGIVLLPCKWKLNGT